MREERDGKGGRDGVEKEGRREGKDSATIDFGLMHEVTLTDMIGLRHAYTVFLQ